MEIKSKLNLLSEKIDFMKTQICSVDETKSAFVLPFIKLLGYDIDNPSEVIFDFEEKLVEKENYKSDYSVVLYQQPIIIIECKRWKEKLEINNSRLDTCFQLSKSRFAILTNGIDYMIYTDTEKPNTLDKLPFLKFKISNLDDTTVASISQLHKTNFNNLNSANNITNKEINQGYLSEIKDILNQQTDNYSSTDFINHLTSQIYTWIFN